MAYDWGSIQLGRFLLRETFTATEQGGNRNLNLAGQESMPPLTRAQLVGVHDNILGLEAQSPVAVTFTDKPERNGYYQVTSNNSTLNEWRNDALTADWTIGLDRLGSVGEVDLNSRLTGVVRLNDFSLTGERWHAPPIGHFGYYTGSSNPTTMTRTGADGAMTVYRSVPAGVIPRWGCDPTNYLKGRARITDTTTPAAPIELEGTGRAVPAGAWALSNGLINVTPSASASFDVQTYSNGAWHSKLWNVSVAGSGSSITSWDSASLLRNDPEHVILRLTRGQSPGRATLDLSLRRGSRFIEGYLQTGTSATLAAYRASLETNTSAAASGYVTATADDADGNAFVIGSARTFTAHANGGIIKAAATALDFFIGAAASQPTLNANPTFDTDTSGWTAVNANLTRSNAQARYGSWSGLITSTAGATPRAEATKVPVTAGLSYRASGWLYSPAVVATSLGLNINWYDAAQVYLSTSSNSSTPASGVWTFMDASFTAPVGAAYAGILYAINGTPGAGVLLYGDDIRLRAATPSGDSALDLRNQYIAALPEATYAVRR
ncbi:hypothetical protein M2155_000580 [Streptomyces sp. SAI-119]|uniref:hypothetical protein n=1 Tax=Streptomyces sp. SAI-119 TaxID=2940541 RepID=UPI0024758132|nr:hypothetical protein [Streptomyces sp. SAI-119]MDH6448172.1 hypothetical protein [Streptomyces sp. SAI-119]